VEETNLSSKPEQISKSAKLISEKIFSDNKLKKIAIIGKNQFTDTLTKIFNKSQNYSLESPNSNFFSSKCESEFNEKIFRILIHYDIIIIGKKSNKLIKKKIILSALKERKQKPFFIIDVNIPSNAEPDIINIDNCFLFDLNDLEQFFSNKMFDEVDKTPSMDDTFYELVEQLELILKTQIRNKVDQVYFIESKFKDFFRLLNNQKEKNTIINFLNFLLKK
tara:strand:- start:449 stop:1111 length:663 start_codon:yes stop_codon:yes gene_type:complete